MTGLNLVHLLHVRSRQFAVPTTPTYWNHHWNWSTYGTAAGPQRHLQPVGSRPGPAREPQSVRARASQPASLASLASLAQPTVPSPDGWCWSVSTEDERICRAGSVLVHRAHAIGMPLAIVPSRPFLQWAVPCSVPCKITDNPTVRSRVPHIL